MEEQEKMAYRAFFDEKRTFGVELEGYGLSRLEIVEALEQEKIISCLCDTFSKSDTYWTVGTDGTIKQSYPIEVISPILSGEKGLRELEKVCSILDGIGLKTDKSCGVHVHWGVSDFTGKSAVNLLSLYAKYEIILDYFFEPHRRRDSNEHSRSLIKADGIEWIYKLNRPFFYQAYQIAQEFERTQQLPNKSSFPAARHHKVNLCAINKYKTIEFRQHHGTFNFQEIKNWIVFSQQLIHRAKDTMIGNGITTWDSLIRTLALTDAQLNESIPRPDKRLLREAREFYKNKYRENREEKVNAFDMG